MPWNSRGSEFARWKLYNRSRSRTRPRQKHDSRTRCCEGISAGAPPKEENSCQIFPTSVFLHCRPLRTSCSRGGRTGAFPPRLTGVGIDTTDGGSDIAGLPPRARAAGLEKAASAPLCVGMERACGTSRQQASRARRVTVDDDGGGGWANRDFFMFRPLLWRKRDWAGGFFSFALLPPRVCASRRGSDAGIVSVDPSIRPICEHHLSEVVASTELLGVPGWRCRMTSGHSCVCAVWEGVYCVLLVPRSPWAMPIKRAGKKTNSSQQDASTRSQRWPAKLGREGV